MGTPSNNTEKQIIKLDKQFKQMWFKPYKYQDLDEMLLTFADDLNTVESLDFSYAYYLLELLAKKLNIDIEPAALIPELKPRGDINSSQWHRITKRHRRKLREMDNARYNNVHGF